MPWQRLVADVALELDGDQLAHREVRVTVPRQSGKTTLLLAVMVHRALAFGRPQQILYAAQSRNDARAKWEEHADLLGRTPFRRLYQIRRTNGSESLRWSNGSRHGIVATTEQSGHGTTLDLGVIDEAFAQRDDRLEQAFRPAMITRPSPQLWIISTAGTAESTYLRGKVDDGRARVDAGTSGPVAYFEWSAPDDTDPADPATWAACMPALGHTVSPADVAADQATMAPGEFARAMLNRWTSSTESVIDLAAWARCAVPESTPLDPVSFAVDVAAERTHAAIAVCGRRADGRLHLEVIDYREGVDWVLDRLEVLRAWAPHAIAWDPAGPIGSISADLDRIAGPAALTLTARDQAAACGGLFDDVVTGAVAHRTQPVLDAAVAGAGRRTLLDGWAWSRRSSAVDISPLVAVTAARFAHLRAPAPAAIL